MFIENPMTTEMLLLQLIDSSVLFAFSGGTMTHSVRSFSLQPDIWYRVLATRYEIIIPVILNRFYRVSSRASVVLRVVTLSVRTLPLSPSNGGSKAIFVFKK